VTFDPNKHLTKLKGKDYLEVKWRMVWFRDAFPYGSITTETLELTDNRAVFRATVTAIDEEGNIRGTATGTKSETPKGFADYIEKAETGSIGRALAALGFGTQFAPELEEGERIVDSPVAPRQEPNLNKPTGPITDTDFVAFVTKCGTNPNNWKEAMDLAGDSGDRWDFLITSAPSEAYRKRFEELKPKGVAA
jgi:hypothetical protein